MMLRDLQLFIDKSRSESAILVSTLCKRCQYLWRSPLERRDTELWEYRPPKSHGTVSRCKCCEFYWRLLGREDVVGHVGPETRIWFSIRSLLHHGDAEPYNQTCRVIVSDYSGSGRSVSNSITSTWYTLNSPPTSHIRAAVLARYQRERLISRTGRVSVSGDSTNSLASFETARFWLQDCLSNHAECASPYHAVSTQKRTLPTRLIDLGGSQPIQPRIRLGSTLPQNTHYITLSHCWGSRKFMTLLESSAETFQRRIPVHKLSKTFRDAMEVSKRLGVRYIWIDSLCIIQGKLRVRTLVLRMHY